jgi:hypothetical protein
MRKSVAAAVVAMALLGAGAASAQAAVYEGTFPDVPKSSISLTFVKKDGKRFLKEFSVSYTTSCENGPTFQGFEGFEPFQRPRVRHGHFEYVEGSPESETYMRLAGDLKRSGKAVGTFEYHLTIPQPNGHCDTGVLDWVAFA